ncbi:unnamed protein product [Eruca vesicaria subsp. sativa]|uniref:GRF-type domain-containing protein n=1 Tax=Eruca vesicaria subsp. sativa TaxID=29727 RepID=A0ABC8IZ93_ERUVS|nr:unnamed protein product [Eruca vesicaria subsp. sativa]
MEERLQKQMGERFEKFQSELRGSVKDVTVNATIYAEEVEPLATKPSPSNQSSTKPSLSNQSPTKPSPIKPSPIKPAPSKPSTSKITSTKPSPSNTTSMKPSPRRSNRLDENLSEAEDMDVGIDTQGLEDLSQASNVPGFDPSQTTKDNKPCDCWTPMSTVRKIKVEPMQENKDPPPTKWNKWKRKLELSDSPMPSDGYPQSTLYWFNEESWDRFNEWSMNPTNLRIGPTIFNTIATRVIGPEKWLGNEEMDAFMYIWRVKNSLRHLTPDRVALPALFCLQIEKAYLSFTAYERGELPSHGRTNKVWGVDVDHLYFPLFVGVEVFECLPRRNKQYVEKFVVMIPRIVKAVTPPENKKYLLLEKYSIVEKTVEVFECLPRRNKQYVEKFVVMIPRIVKAVTPPENKKYLLLEKYSIVEVPLKARLNKSLCDCGAYALKHLECQLLGLDLREKLRKRKLGDRVNYVFDQFSGRIKISSTQTTGIPTRCRCGEGAVLFTSKTWENPGRLFHYFPMGSEKDKTHLFKWTDKSVVEEIEDLQEVVDVVLIDNIQFRIQ